MAYPEFRAFYIEQPTTHAHISYKVFRSLRSRTSLSLLTQKSFYIPLNEQHEAKFEHQSLTIRLAGVAPDRRLQQGTYFVRNGAVGRGEILSSLEINNKGEWNLQKLGKLLVPKTVLNPDL